jgi:hypothetical protein
VRLKNAAGADERVSADVLPRLGVYVRLKSNDNMVLVFTPLALSGVGCRHFETRDTSGYGPWTNEYQETVLIDNARTIRDALCVMHPLIGA